MKPLLISSTSLASFMRCRRQYYYEWELLMEGKTPDYMTEGSDIHKYLEDLTKGGLLRNELNLSDTMAQVTTEYVRYHPLPPSYICCEEPVWYDLIPGVKLRITPDLIYPEGDWIIIRDYKTFAKESTPDVDLDLQGKLYTAIGREVYKTKNVLFKYEYIRRTPPNVPKDKAGKCWSPEECYHTVEVYSSDIELQQTLEDARDVARDLVRARAEGRWYREPRRDITGRMCGDCKVKEICTNDFMQGGLSAADLEVLANKRKPLELPKEMNETNV